MAHRQPVKEPKIKSLIDTAKIKLEHKQDTRLTKPLEVQQIGSPQPSVLELGDGIKIIEGLPLFNKNLRQFISNLFTTQLANATDEFGQGQFENFLPQAQEALGLGPPEAAIPGLPDGGSLGTPPPQAQPDLLAAEPGIGGFIDQVPNKPGLPGASPGAAGVATAATVIQALSSLKDLFGGEPDQPVQVNSGSLFVPQFETDDSNSLQAFIQLLMSQGNDGGALPVGASPFHAGVPERNVGASPFHTGVEGKLGPTPEGMATLPVVGGGAAQPPQQAFPGAPAPPTIVDTGPGSPNFNTDPGDKTGNFQPGQATLPVVGGGTVQPPGQAFPGPGGAVPAPDPLVPGPGVPPPGQAFPGGPDAPQIPNALPGNNAFSDIIQQFSLPTFGGNTGVGPTPLQQQSTEFASDFLGTNPFTDTANIQGALQSLIGGERFDNTPEFEAIEARSQRRLGEESAQLRELFGAQGARFGSDIARGQADLSSRFLENEALQRAQIGRQSFQDAQQNRLGALPLPGQLGQQQLNQATSVFNLGQAGQAAQERDIQRQMAEFARTQGALFPQLLNFAGLGVEGDTTVINPNQLPG